METPNGEPEFLPTEEEIRRECERIQAEWTSRERRFRQGVRHDAPRMTVRRVRAVGVKVPVESPD